jgi:hypothetical protein
MIDPDVLRNQAVSDALDQAGICPGCELDEVETFIEFLKDRGYVVVRKPEAEEE